MESFQNGGEVGWPINTLFWVSERGDNKFQAFGRVTQKGGDMYYWWDKQLCDNTCLISHNKYLVFYSLKKN